MSNYDYFVDEEIYPIDASLWGTNAYYFSCSVRSGVQANCICTNKLKAFDENRRVGILEECVGAISTGSCPARAMRQEEVLAGKAIYFVNRKKLQAANEARDAALKAEAPARWGEKKKQTYSTTPSKGVEKTVPTVGEAQHRPATKPAAIEDGYAAAINRALSDLKVEKVAPESPKVTSAPPMTAGMSLIEMARQRMASKV